MSRVTKPSKSLNVNLDINIDKDLEEFLAETECVCFTKTSAVENALKAYIKYFRETGKLLT